jgi:hypothetical protein
MTMLERIETAVVDDGVVVAVETEECQAMRHYMITVTGTVSMLAVQWWLAVELDQCLSIMGQPLRGWIGLMRRPVLHRTDFGEVHSLNDMAPIRRLSVRTYLRQALLECSMATGFEWAVRQACQGQQLAWGVSRSANCAALRTDPDKWPGTRRLPAAANAFIAEWYSNAPLASVNNPSQSIPRAETAGWLVFVPLASNPSHRSWASALLSREVYPTSSYPAEALQPKGAMAGMVVRTPCLALRGFLLVLRLAFQASLKGRRSEDCGGGRGVCRTSGLREGSAGGGYQGVEKALALIWRNIPDE